MRVLVTGGTGFVGREIVRHLCAAGHSVVLLVRHPGSPVVKELESSYGLESRAGDVLQLDSLALALKGVDAVVHLVGIISEVGRATFHNVHVRGTENILAAAQAEGVPKIVHMSALGSRPSAVSRYHQTKWAAEEAVRGSGLRWTIFRPSLIYGLGDGFVNLFAQLSRFSPVLPVLGRPEAVFEPVAVQLVAKAFAEALTLPQCFRQVYDLCSPEALTLGQMLDAILEVVGRRRLKVRIPDGVASLQARFLQWFFPCVLGKPAPLNLDQLMMLNEGNVGDCRPADQLFGLEHLPFKQGIAAYLKK